ncbi:tRNA methyltransferase 61 [Dermatophagoides farinae]|nr:tRNA (adenine(58)-N(1))-methyltransferase catalytic subunit TRMT61A-like [Dermatophagoides farinae]
MFYQLVVQHHHHEELFFLILYSCGSFDNFYIIIVKMSFCLLKKTIDEGDTVVIYLTPRQMYRVKVDRDEVFQTRLGALRLEELIGKPYGSRIQCSKGHVLVLDMTPEIWTLLLPHRTQILYGPDISMILMNLQLRSGSLVIEAGTGSGSLSHSIARTIAPNGKLFTFDFHEKRVEIAKKEFREHGIDSIVNVQQRDVCTEGFQFLEPLKFDAVFLDLPNPWEAIESAQRVLKSGGKICCFSPCIEQVQRSCQTLAKLNFLDIETIECVLRPYEIRKASYEKLKFCDNLFERSDSVNDELFPKILDHSDDQDQCSVNEDFEHIDDNGINGTNKRLRTMDEKDIDKDLNQKSEKDDKTIKENRLINYWVTYMNTEVTGHSGFLTFATNFIF